MSNQDAGWLAERFRGLSFVQPSALAMPFADNSFDLVFSSALIEHAGNSENQKQLLKECARVARRFVFLTIPNRYHPMKFHTALPLIHVLPKKTNRAILKKLSMDFFAQEENLNLLSKRDMLILARQAWASGAFGKVLNSCALYTERFLGIPLNLLLFARKG
ncbi:MAG: class I SAM-dependent methyltransferase [Azoarcus sp.]|nr:class I SAM-dependent methyltransferase [Azoarcus sp.]